MQVGEVKNVEIMLNLVMVGTMVEGADPDPEVHKGK